MACATRLHGLGPLRHLRSQIACILIDCEQRAQIEEKTQYPCGDADQKNRCFQVGRIRDDTCQEWRKRRACILDEIFNGLRR